jgi:hypothetical protein
VASNSHTGLSSLPTHTIATHISTVPKVNKIAGGAIVAIPHGDNTSSLAQTADPVEVKSLVGSASSKPADDHTNYYWAGDLEKEVKQFDGSSAPVHSRYFSR